jgi:hypothetical protein
MSDWHQSLEGFVTASRRTQGLPDRVTDPAVLAKVAVLLRPQHHRHPEGDRPTRDGQAAVPA